MITKKCAAAGLGLIMATALLAGCSADAPAGPAVEEGEGLVIDGELIADADLFAAAQEEGSFVFYTGASEQSETVLAERFTKDTGVQVEIVRLAPNRLTERILSEQGAGQLGADVIRISGEDLTLAVADSGAFTPYDVPEEYVLPEGTKIDGGAYYRSFDRVYTVVYNNQLVDEADAPESWEDMLDDKFAGKLGITQVAAGGSTAALTRFQLDELGEDYLRDFAAMNPRIFDSAGALSDALARGEISVGSLPIATAYGAKVEGAPLTIVTPEEGAAAFSYYLGVTENAANTAAAQLFVNWSMSRAGQTASGEGGDYPVREDIPAPRAGDQELPAVDSGFLFRYDAEETLAHVEEDAALWREIFGYTG
ncbi:iron(III) transport system substrate-binding protein [Homoserinimonas aerilata]|uniref:Iron(III) transport system substrate-binding protein n=1 Tax=Homoserinimonas aerilata TaxID=1162970 RepID=A0A542YAA6_9MICO|nr:ABC transporter substrate-binding protein [Homoserinimonas aerilata]TQL45038.1 iron(III) transport system substrate-binding protein [Homoserinimonas aerilata]